MIEGVGRAVVGEVVPGRGADAQAEAPSVDGVEFAQPVNALGDEPAVAEVVVAGEGDGDTNVDPRHPEPIRGRDVEHLDVRLAPFPVQLVDMVLLCVTSFFIYIVRRANALAGAPELISTETKQ